MGQSLVNTPFPEFIEYKANYNNGLLSMGGKISITPQLIFRPHPFNIGNLKERVFEIKDIIGYKKGFLTFLMVKKLNYFGKKMKSLIN